MLSVRAIAACLALVTGIGAASEVRHVHIANPVGRVMPLSRDEYDYAPFFESLRRIRYRGRISIDARAVGFAGQSPKSIAFLRALSR
jgi:hydroxypyruvate isomerase